MKIKDGFILREIAGSFVVVPVGQRVAEFNGLLTLSESGALLWREMEKDSSMESLVEAICCEYDIDASTAQSDVCEFINGMLEKGFVIHE